MNVANHAVLVDDESGGPGNPFSRMQHPEVFDNSLLRVRYQAIPNAQLPRRLIHFKRIVRADGDNFGLKPMNSFGKSLELDELPLADDSEVAPIEDHHEALPALEVGELEALDFEIMRLMSHLGAILIMWRGRRHVHAHQEESERRHHQAQSSLQMTPAPSHRGKPPDHRVNNHQRGES